MKKRLGTLFEGKSKNILLKTVKKIKENPLKTASWTEAHKYLYVVIFPEVWILPQLETLGPTNISFTDLANTDRIYL